MEKEKMETERTYPVKIGYVKVLDYKGNIQRIFRYEELYLSLRKRQEAAYLCSVNRGKICCCCLPTKTVNINIESDGTVSFPDIASHSSECVRFMNEMTSYVDFTPIRSISDDLPIRVRFNWERPVSSITDAQQKDLEIARKRELTFSQWLMVNNALAFSGNHSFDLSPGEMCGIFTDRIGSQTIEYLSKGTDITVRTRGDFLFRDGMESGTAGFYYGKVLDIPAKYNSGKGKNIYIIVSKMRSGGNLITRRDIFLRVPKEKFMIPYERLPDKRHAYIAGFIQAKDVILDAADVKISSSVSVNPTKSGSVRDYPGNAKKRINELRMGCLFTAADNGLAVFTADEFTGMQKASSEKKVCYRQITEGWGDVLSLNVENMNGDDERL